MQSGFCRVVDRAKYIWHFSSQTTNLNNCTLGFNQQWCECLTHAHNAKDIDIVRQLDLIKVNVCGRDSVVATSIVDEIVELSTCARCNLVFQSFDACRVGDFERERFDTKIGKVGDAVGVSGGCEHAEASGVKLARELVANAAGVCAGDQNRLLGHDCVLRSEVLEALELKRHLDLVSKSCRCIFHRFSDSPTPTDMWPCATLTDPGREWRSLAKLPTALEIRLTTTGTVHRVNRCEQKRDDICVSCGGFSS